MAFLQRVKNFNHIRLHNACGDSALKYDITQGIQRTEKRLINSEAIYAGFLVEGPPNFGGVGF